MPSHSQAQSAADVRLEEALTKARAVARVEKEAAETALMDEMSSLKRRHAEEMAAVNKRAEDGAALVTLTAQVTFPGPHSMQCFRGAVAYPSSCPSCVVLVCCTLKP